ncbi:hypothetical protein R1sor_009980 [Riccia sorocarpa]|uniref:glutathione transferase n=1 Tax=Riccia sorocarpa TaxID=122646 RepID=A0ABD3HYN7_9MARC
MGWYSTQGRAHSVIRFWSGATRNVIAALYEKGVEFELVMVDLKSGVQKQPEHLKLQPAGLPRRRNHPLRSRNALVQYGKTPTDKALVEQWIEVESQNYHPVITALNYELLVKKIFTGEAPDEAAVAAEVPKLNAVLDIYEARLTESISSRPSWQKTITYGSS